MTSRPHILITNDDGIHAEGLYSLWRALKDHAIVTIVAPAHEQSGSALGTTTRRPLHIKKVPWEGDTQAYQVDGTPADCVKLAMNVLSINPPNLVASGINQGCNAGRTLLYSGTVAGVIEGVMRNIPGIAFSSEDFHHPNFVRAEPFIMPLVRYLLDHPLPPGSFFNVTFPDHQDAIKGVKMARQGKGRWVEELQERVHPQGHHYYWLGGKWAQFDEHEESDIHLVQQGYLTVVPIHVHELTDHVQFNHRKGSFERWFTEQPQKHT